LLLLIILPHFTLIRFLEIKVVISNTQTGKIWSFTHHLVCLLLDILLFAYFLY